MKSGQTRARFAGIAVLLLTALGSPTASVNAKSDRHEPDRWVLPGAAVFPEGIAIDEKTGQFFVGSTTDGTIFSGNAEEAADTTVFLPGGGDGRTAAIGMKVDSRRGRLFVSGGGLGKVFVYDIATKALLAQFAGGLSPTFINDVTIVPNGDAYFTDSLSSAIYRLSADLQTFERFTDFAGTPLTYVAGFNLNGIAATADGAYLITVQSNTGKLFRIDIASKQVVEIERVGAVVQGGDGIFLKNRTLHVLRNSAALLLTFKMSDDFSAAELRSVTTDSSFQFPTTFGRYEDRILVVNSQFDKRATAPVLPFNVSAIDAPESGNGKKLAATLTGAAEVPAGDVDGSGSASITLKPKKDSVCFSISVRDITLPAAASHIHTGAAGVNGPVVVDFVTPPDAAGRTEGCVTATRSVINAIWSNPAGHYVNVHNSDFPRGAVRGQLSQSSSSDDDDKDSDKDNNDE